MPAEVDLERAARKRISELSGEPKPWYFYAMLLSFGGLAVQTFISHEPDFMDSLFIILGGCVVGGWHAHDRKTRFESLVVQEANRLVLQQERLKSAGGGISVSHEIGVGSDNPRATAAVSIDYGHLKHPWRVIRAANSAQRVLHHFERSFPNDLRPRQAIDAAKKWANGELDVLEARRASTYAHIAARSVADPAAKAAARAAAYAAYSTHLIEHIDRVEEFVAKCEEIVRSSGPNRPD